MSSSLGTQQGETTCTSKINKTFYLYSLIPAVLICMSFALTRRRRNILLSVLNGHPGLLIPMDALTRLSRVSYACAFGATTNLVYKIVIDGELAFDYDGPKAVLSLMKIVSVMIYGMVFYPLFACLVLGSVFGYGLGALYVWMLTIVEIYQLTECPDLPAEGRVIVVFRGLPIVGCLLYLSLSIPARIVRAARAGRFLVGVSESEEEDASLDDIRRVYIGRHVTKLLKKPEMETAGPLSGARGVLQAVQSFGLRTVHRWRYRWKHGFRYPARLLSVMFVSLLVVYQTSLLFLATLIPIGHLIEITEAEVQDCQICDLASMKLKLSGLRVLRVSMVLSIVLAFVFTFANVVHMLTSFRKNLQDMYKGNHSYIPQASMSTNSRLCVGSIKYGGFQVAYIAVGFLVQFVILFLVILIFGFLCVETPSVFLSLLETTSPWVVAIVLLLIVQHLLAIFVFLQDRAAYLALDNRGCYFVFTYFMLFYNMFLGVASILLRVGKSMVLGTLMLSRLDYSVLPRKFEFLDLGYKAYLGYLQMEYTHTHPVMLLFCRLLLLGSRHKRAAANDRDVFADLGEVEAHDGSGSQSSRRAAVRRKWHVTYTLLRNPSLVHTRKVFNQSARSRRLAAGKAVAVRGEGEQGMESVVRNAVATGTSNTTRSVGRLNV